MPFTPKTVGFKPKERNIFFHILTACNLACRHCYINPEQHGTQTVSKKTMEDWLRLFYQEDKNTNLIFLGGEPTLHKDLSYGIKTAKKLGYQTVTVDTNGYVFHHLLENITPEDAVISFSLDGPTASINDPIRGDNVFATCTKNLKKAITLGFDVSVIYTVSRMNISSLEQMPDLLHAMDSINDRYGGSTLSWAGYMPCRSRKPVISPAWRPNGIHRTNV